jgi:hypothetical protein
MTIPCIRNSALLIRSCVRTHKRQLGDFFNTNSLLHSKSGQQVNESNRLITTPWCSWLDNSMSFLFGVNFIVQVLCSGASVVPFLL